MPRHSGHLAGAERLLKGIVSGFKFSPEGACLTIGRGRFRGEASRAVYKGGIDFTDGTGQYY